MADMTLGRAVLELTTDGAGLDKGIVAAQRKAENLGKAFIKTGKELSLMFTAPFVAAMGMSVKEAGKAQEAQAKLANAIKTTGMEGKISVDVLSQLAGGLQKVSTFGDEAQLEALTLVQQLGKLDEKGLVDLLPRMLNMAAAKGMDLQSVADLVGKTLGSTTNALGRYGVELDGNASKADKLAKIMQFMDASFGGAAEAAATAGLGPLAVMKNQLSDLGEKVGTVLLPAMSQVIGILGKVIDFLSGIDKDTLQFIITIASLAATLGPLAIGIGQVIKVISTMSAVLKAGGGVMSMLSSGPIGLIIAAVAALAVGVYLLIKNWDTVVAFFKDLWEKVKGFFIEAWESIKAFLAKIWQWVKDHIEWILMAINPLAGAVVLIIKNWDKISAFFQKLWADILGFFTSAKDKIIQTVTDLFNGVWTWLVEKFQAVVNKVKESLEKVKGFFKDLFNVVVGHSIVPDMVDAIIGEFDRMKKGIGDITADVVKTLTTGFVNAMVAVGGALASGEDGWEAFKESAKDTIASILEMLAQQLAVFAVMALIPGPTFNPAGAALAFAGAAAAGLAAGVVRAMAGGGTIAEPVVGMGLTTGAGYLLGERGPERVVPFGGGEAEAVVSTPLIIQIDGKPLYQGMLRATQDRIALVSERAIVR